MSSNTPITFPTSLAPRLLLLVSWLLGWLLITDGLFQRITNTYWPAWAAWWVWPAWARGLGLAPVDTGWPLICLGSTLLGASFGVIGRRPWGGALMGVGLALALAYAWPGTVLAAAGLAVWIWPAARRFLQPD